MGCNPIERSVAGFWSGSCETLPSTAEWGPGGFSPGQGGPGGSCAPRRRGPGAGKAPGSPEGSNGDLKALAGGGVGWGDEK